MTTETAIAELREIILKTLARPERKHFYYNLINHLEEQERTIASLRSSSSQGT